MDNAHGSHGGYNNTPPELPTVSNGTLTITEQAPEQETGATTADLPQSRAPYHPTAPGTSPTQANDTRTRGRDVVRSTGNQTPMEEHQCHSPRRPYRIQTQPVPNMRPCQETQGRYGAVEATQKV